MRFLKTLPRCFAWKEHGGLYGTAGIPDIICCVDGRFTAFEVKAPGGRITPLQRAALDNITAAGGGAFLVTSVEEVKEALKSLKSVKKFGGWYEWRRMRTKTKKPL